MIFTVTAELIRSRRFRQLGICAGMCFAGLLLSLLPAVLFYYKEGILYEMLEAVFVLGFKYSGEKSFSAHVAEVFLGDRKYLLLLLFIPCVLPFLLSWRSWRERLLIFSGTLFTFFAISAGNNYTHYYTLAIPLVVLGEAASADLFRCGKKKRSSLAIILIVAMLVSQHSIIYMYVTRADMLVFHQERFNLGILVRDVSSRIPEEDSDSVFCYNLNPAWYTYADLFPCFKYCGWQRHYIELMPEIADELEKLLQVIFLINLMRFHLIRFNLIRQNRIVTENVRELFFLLFWSAAGSFPEAGCERFIRVMLTGFSPASRRISENSIAFSLSCSNVHSGSLPFQIYSQPDGSRYSLRLLVTSFIRNSSFEPRRSVFPLLFSIRIVNPSVLLQDPWKRIPFFSMLPVSVLLPALVRSFSVRICISCAEKTRSDASAFPAKQTAAGRKMKNSADNTLFLIRS